MVQSMSIAVCYLVNVCNISIALSEHSRNDKHSIIVYTHSDLQVTINMVHPHVVTNTGNNNHGVKSN